MYIKSFQVRPFDKISGTGEPFDTFEGGGWCKVVAPSFTSFSTVNFDFPDPKPVCKFFECIILDDLAKKRKWRYPTARAPNLLEPEFTGYSILATQILLVKQKHPKVLEFASISYHNAFLADQEAFKPQVWFWFVLALCLYSQLLQSSVTFAASIFQPFLNQYRVILPYTVLTWLYLSHVGTGDMVTIM